MNEQEAWRAGFKAGAIFVVRELGKEFGFAVTKWDDRDEAHCDAEWQRYQQERRSED